MQIFGEKNSTPWYIDLVYEIIKIYTFYAPISYILW